MVQAWMRDEVDGDQEKPHKRSPNVDVSLEELEQIGITYKKMNPDMYAEGNRYHEDPELKEFTEKREFSFSDVLEITTEALPDYNEKLKCFYKEHFHLDDECRYVIGGSGYFDFRNQQDEWIRVFIEKGDLLFMPAGLYHRFSLDETNYLKSIRLFVAEAIWTPVYRPAEDHFTRKTYVKKYLKAK